MVRDGRVGFGKLQFVVQAAPIIVARAKIFAVEPVKAIEARAIPYRKRLFVAAVATLILAAAFAHRLGPRCRVWSRTSRG